MRRGEKAKTKMSISKERRGIYTHLNEHKKKNICFFYALNKRKSKEYNYM